VRPGGNLSPGRTASDERGQVTVMILGFLVLVVLVAVVVVDASAAYLHRQSLSALADGAALAAADGVQGRQVYAGGLGDVAQIDPDVARRHVDAYLRSTGALQEYPGLRCGVSGDADSVRVHLSAVLDLPLSPPGWAQRTQVAGEAAVQLRVY